MPRLSLKLWQDLAGGNFHIPISVSEPQQTAIGRCSTQESENIRVLVQTRPAASLYAYPQWD
jgi:hypothetical protein